MGALTISKETGAVLVDKELCTGCGKCIDECPGRIPHMHPSENYVLICDLCGGEPRCVKVCREGEWNALKTVPREDRYYKVYAQTPEQITRDLVANLYGEEGKELI